MVFSLDFVAAGGNRHPSAADWRSGILAFGAGKNLAIWNVGQDGRQSISQLLAGHAEDINAVRFFERKGQWHIITGSADKTLRIWEKAKDGAYRMTQTLEDHSGSINAITILEDDGLFVSGSADGSVKIWDFSSAEVTLVQSVTLKPRYIPLTCALAKLDDGAFVLAVAGTSNYIQLYCRTASSTEFHLQATLAGHEGWIRSLDFAKANSLGDLLLASASQDKFIRLWRFSSHREAVVNGTSDPASDLAKKSLSNKTHEVGDQDHKYIVTFEALLIGHEDWIYTIRWAPKSQNDLRLLSSSADNSLAIWRADESSGVWVCESRLGEISSQKGSTTATGSTGGFWIGLWQPDGKGLASLGRTGSWRRWRYDDPSDTWLQQTSIGGHVKEVQGLAWTPDGSYLLSTASDQTSRLWAEWQKDGRRSWHEFARPQIHGYDLNCISALTANQFVSGADEKLLRVFNKPKAIDDLLSKLCGHQSSIVNGDLPDAANMPVLGLSNKAIAAAPDDELQVNGVEQDRNDRDSVDPAAVVHKSTLDLDHPPLEDHLARHTLWPEHEKLYGHGYEISAVAASPDGSVVATACKASSLDHAVIRIYECKEWREVKPSLKAHSLTVTALAFSPDSRWLLSVGRDRQWALFRRDGDAATKDAFALFKTDPKGHSRMILDCCWAPTSDGVFATAGRDKAVKIWRITGEDVVLASTVTTAAAVTAINFAPSPSTAEGEFRLAYGTETGAIGILDVARETLDISDETALPAELAPSAAVNTLRWRPLTEDHAETGSGVDGAQLAIASDDASVRIVNIRPG